MCVVVTMMRMVVCGSEDGSRCVVVTMMSMVVGVVAMMMMRMVVTVW